MQVQCVNPNAVDETDGENADDGATSVTTYAAAMLAAVYALVFWETWELTNFSQIDGMEESKLL
jgi:hypothetical protein